MPIAKIQLPDGRIAKFEVPDGTTPDEVLEFANSNMDKLQPPSAPVNAPAPTKPSRFLPQEGGGGDSPVIPEGTDSFVSDIIKNTPGSAVKLAGNVISVLNPFNWGDIAQGVSTLATDENARQQVADEMYKQYVTNLPETIRTDPVDPLSMFLGGGALASQGVKLAAKTTAKVAPKAAGVAGRVAKAADTVSDTFNAIDPANAVMSGAAKGASAVAKGGKGLATSFIGATTGTGQGAVERALKNSEAFRQGLDKSATTVESIVEDAKGLSTKLSDMKRAQYQEDMARVKSWTQQLDINKVANKFNDLKGKYGLEDVVDTAGNSVGVRRTGTSRLSKQEVAEVQQLFDELQTWQTEVGGVYTPETLDILKSRIDDFYSENSKVRGMVSELRNNVKGMINEATQGEYNKAMGNYEKFSELERELNKTLSLNDKASIDTSFKKLTSTLRQNFEGRAELLEAVQGLGIDADSVLDKVAGYQMRDWRSKGLTGIMAVGASLASPKMVPVLAATSPKIMSSFLRSAGWTNKQVGQFMSSPFYRQVRKSWGTSEGRAALSTLGKTQEENNAAMR